MNSLVYNQPVQALSINECYNCNIKKTSPELPWASCLSVVPSCANTLMMCYMWQRRLSGILVPPSKPVGTSEERGQQTDRETEKEMDSAKRLLPAAWRHLYTIMISSSMCGFVSVCLSLHQGPSIQKELHKALYMCEGESYSPLPSNIQLTHIGHNMHTNTHFANLDASTYAVFFTNTHTHKIYPQTVL